MGQVAKIEIEETVVEEIRLRIVEKDCPKCDSVLSHNQNEQCYECDQCGYIDCGEDNNTVKRIIRRISY
jgi:ribosomal protein S27AE